ncbi:TlyA family RNA methyltransferase [Euzebya rosea]|uniref:TlyA family RNA methyltransferase n=1 Tax=Euzebya rosea TaxID=2052804 RepID=UPI000D3EDD50|nr:TlyA family RNA methyltransferase [Euzebya rosea]
MTGARRARLDAELVRRELAPSRTAARALIEAGSVRVDGVAVPKPASQVTRDQAIHVVDDGPRFASRGGLKLDGALEDLGVDVAGAVALDAGAAHGGFTDVLLRRGAVHVVAVDVAYGQLDWRLRSDERVTLLERTNVRHLTPEDLAPHRPDVIVADLSFISLGKVLPALASLAADRATALPMVKPQFEAGAAAVGKGGVVRDPATWVRTMHEVAETAAGLGFRTLGAAPSRAPGPAGNIEFFLHLHRDPAGDPPGGNDLDDILAAAAEAGLELRS